MGVDVAMCSDVVGVLTKRYERKGEIPPSTAYRDRFTDAVWAISSVRECILGRFLFGMMFGCRMGGF